MGIVLSIKKLKIIAEMIKIEHTIFALPFALAAVVLLLGMAAQFGFAANYYVPNTYVYYLPVYVWLAACAAVRPTAPSPRSKRLRPG